MPTKQIKLTLQATPSAEQDVNLSIAVDGSVKFNQSVPAIGPSVQGISEPTASIEFDLDVVLATANALTANHDFAITATNGRAKIETISANWTVMPAAMLDPTAAPGRVPGSADNFDTCNIVSQPLWNGQALLERYNIIYNNGPEQITGAGEVLIESGETVACTVAVGAFNNSLPLPD